MKNKTSQSGFTLIELIAVMVILGILAAVIIPRITTITSGAYESNVRNMYGLIKNEVTAQAVKAAMTGDYLETYPEPAAACDGCPTVIGDMQALDYYLKTWVGDYDEEQWSSFIKMNHYDNSVSGVADGMDLTNVVLFMYHPHGKPDATLSWAMNGVIGGSSVNKEDLYFIWYAPRTSSSGKLKGRELDGFVMGAWKNMNLAVDFDGTLSNLGVAIDNGDDPLQDLIYLYAPEL